MFLKKKLSLFCGLIAFLTVSLLGINNSVSAASVLDDPGAGEQFKYEDEDLLKFVESNQEISKLRREYNENIEEMVEAHGLTMDRFNQIARASQIGALDSGNFSSEETDAFNEAAPQVTQLRREMRSITEAILAEKGMTNELYREILSDYRSDQELQTYVRDLLRERERERVIEERREDLIQNLMEEEDISREEAEKRIVRRSEAEIEEELEEQE